MTDLRPTDEPELLEGSATPIAPITKRLTRGQLVRRRFFRNRGAVIGLIIIGRTPQGRWLAEEAWRFGFIVRYEAGHETVTGYQPEPWPLRWVGRAIAADYHRDGWTSLEGYAGLPAAPDYPNR